MSMEHQLYGSILPPEQRSCITMHIKKVTVMDKAPTIYLSVSEDERATKFVALA